ncbi:reverse transcriptase domain-containing protein [Tanacetum coccineum]
MGVPEVMKILSFMDSLKCSELVKHFSIKVPTMVNEMMGRLDDFVRSKEAFAQTELPKGEVGDHSWKFSFPAGRREERPYRSHQGGEEKGRYTNDCIQLKRQLEIALESGRLNLLVKDVRQMGRGNQRGDVPQLAKIINMIRTRSTKEKKRKAPEVTEVWMNTLITFPQVSSEDVSDEPLIVEAESGDGQVERDTDRFGRFRQRGYKAFRKDGAGGIVTLVTRSIIILECMRLEKKQVVKAEPEEKEREERTDLKDVNVTEEVLVNPTSLDQLVVIGGGLTKARNYSPLEKLALSLFHMTRRLMRYFEAHPVKVITDQPIKQILNKTEASRKLAKYVVELGTYNITFEPRNAVKGQVLADFISETPDGEPVESYFRVPEATPEEEDSGKWMLFTDGASRTKGLGAGLVLIGPSAIEHMYALRLIFTSTTNEAEYEALLAGLRIARKMKIHDLETKVDSKLVVIQINGSYIASSDNMIKYLAKARECVGPLQANYVIREIYIGECGMHSGPRAVIHSLVPKLLKTLMTSIMAPWPFYRWDMDIVGPIPQAAEKVKFLIVAIDYFTKWIEVKPLARITEKEVIPNGWVESANKSLMEGIKTRMGKDRAGWVKELSNVLWAHRTSIKQSNGETPFSLTYGSEVVIPAEIGMPTNRTMVIREGLDKEELCLNLDLLQEMREMAVIQEEKYKTKLEQYYNKGFS